MPGSVPTFTCCIFNVARTLLAEYVNLSGRDCGLTN